MGTTNLTNQDDILRWREAKTEADRHKHYRTQLGCVGEPISDAFDKVLRAITCPDVRADAQGILDEAAAEARGNLCEYVNDARQEGADELLADLEHVEFDAYDLEIDSSDTLAEVAERGFELAVRTITGQCWNVTQVSLEDM